MGTIDLDTEVCKLQIRDSDGLLNPCFLFQALCCGYWKMFNFRVKNKTKNQVIRHSVPFSFNMVNPIQTSPGFYVSAEHCGKKRNCSLRAISHFATVFSKGLFPRGVKRCCCVGMG